MEKLPEVWLRGIRVEGITGQLQPVAHALLQAREEIMELMKDFPEEELWLKVAGVASPAFHLKHITGVIDRLFTYANGASLTMEQLDALKAEEKDGGQTVHELLNLLTQKIDWALEQLKTVKEDKLLEQRGVGRAQLPSTVLGLLVHSAEHTMRHVGQLLVTVRMIQHQRI